MNRPSYKELWLYERKDRDEQLQWIRDAVDGNAKFRNSEPPYSEEEELARQVMTMHTRIAELEAGQRWIPVSERLPEVSEEVFVCDESGHRRVDWLVCKPIDGVGETLFYSAAYDDDPPTHWLPLPKLPEVQESEATSCKFCGSNKSDIRMNSIVCTRCGRKIGELAPSEVQE